MSPRGRNARKSYRDLLVWKRAMDLASSCYTLSESFPERAFGSLTSDLRHAVVQISAEIAKGNGRFRAEQYIFHLSAAHGAVYETETYLLLAVKLGYIEHDAARDVLALTEEIAGLIEDQRDQAAR